MWDLAVTNHLNEIVAHHRGDGEYLCPECAGGDVGMFPISRGNLPVDVSIYCEECATPICETLKGSFIRLLNEARVALGDDPDNERDFILIGEIDEALGAATFENWR